MVLSVIQVNFVEFVEAHRGFIYEDDVVILGDEELMTVSLILILDIMECLEVDLNIVWYASRDQIELRNTLEFIRLCLFTIK